MAQAQPFSADVETFLRRALPHFMSGKSAEDSMRAVLEDDARLAGAFFARGTTHYFPTPDERGRSYHDGVKVGDVIAAEISSEVYAKARGLA
jgi:hypothetical protein